jgi:YbgC/YbaW family acyl-CoA thioester hydrolase
MTSLALTDFRHLERLRVRWSEIDAQQIVFNGHYLTYFDTAVAGYWRAMALPYHETMAQLQGDLYVRKASVEYHGSARYDDLLQVGMRCARVGNSSIVFDAGVYRHERLLVSGELIYVFADPATQTPRPVPEALRECLLTFEAGAPMLTVRNGSWTELSAVAAPLRRAVFVDEQQVPADLEWDEADAQALHVVALNRLGMAVGTGRLLEHAPGIGRVGRMAVHQAARGAGVGQMLLDALLAAARQRGDSEVLLHAQTTAAPFYSRAGFTPRGENFVEAGITHVEMTRSI